MRSLSFVTYSFVVVVVVALCFAGFPRDGKVVRRPPSPVMEFPSTRPDSAQRPNRDGAKAAAEAGVAPPRPLTPRPEPLPKDRPPSALLRSTVDPRSVPSSLRERLRRRGGPQPGEEGPGSERSTGRRRRDPLCRG